MQTMLCFFNPQGNNNDISSNSLSDHNLDLFWVFTFFFLSFLLGGEKEKDKFCLTSQVFRTIEILALAGRGQ